MILEFEEIVLDCRMLESPEPMNLVISNLDKCDANSYIKMVHRIEPTPLMGILRANGFNSKISRQDGDVLLYIWINTAKKLESYIEEL